MHDIVTLEWRKHFLQLYLMMSKHVINLFIYRENNANFRTFLHYPTVKSQYNTTNLLTSKVVSSEFSRQYPARFDVFLRVIQTDRQELLRKSGRYDNAALQILGHHVGEHVTRC